MDILNFVVVFILGSSLFSGLSLFSGPDSLLFRAAPWADDSGGEQKHLHSQLGLYMNNNFKADYSGIKRKCGLHIMRPHLEK